MQSDCELKLVGCSDKYQRASVSAFITFDKGGVETTEEEYTSIATFASSDPASLEMDGSTTKGAPPGSRITITSGCYSAVATLSVSVVEENLEIVDMQLMPFTGLFRARVSSSGEVGDASPCNDNCVSSQRLQPNITLSDGTAYDFVGSSLVREVDTSDVLSFSMTGGAYNDNVCTGSALSLTFSGRATIRGQSAEIATLTMQALASGSCAPEPNVVSLSNEANVNMDPATNDVDLGQSDQVVSSL